MNLNATLIVQLIVFFILAWFTKRYVWPPMVRALDERARRVAEGIAASMLAKKELEEAREESRREIQSARRHAAEICEIAEHQAAAILEKAHSEANQVISSALLRAEKESEALIEKARSSLCQEFSQVVIETVQKIVAREVSVETHKDLLSQCEEDI